MRPVFVLLISFIVSIIIIRLAKRNMDYALAGRISLVCMFIFTGIGHFIFSDGMSAMIPRFIPYKKELVFITGIMEIVLGAGLLFPKYQKVSAWLLILFLFLVLPANIKAALEHINYQTGKMDGPGTAYLWVRIPLQLFYVIWIYLMAIKHK